MAIKKSKFMEGVYAVPNVDAVGEISEVMVVWDTTATADGVIASGDYLQLIQLPANAVLVDVQLFSSATFGATTTFAMGIKTDATTATNATTLITAANLTTSVLAATRIGLATVAPKAAPTVNENIVGVLVAAANTAANIKLYAAIKYRAALHGV